MRWSERTEKLVRDALDQDSCPLCGGRVRQRTRRVFSRAMFGGWADEMESVCDNCGARVGEVEWDGDF